MVVFAVVMMFAVVMFAAVVMFFAAVVVVVMTVVTMFFAGVVVVVMTVMMMQMMMFRPFVDKQAWRKPLGRFYHGPANIFPGIVCLIIRQLPGRIACKANDSACRFELAVFAGEPFELHFKESTGHLSQVAADGCSYGSAEEGACGRTCQGEYFFDDAAQDVFEDTACAACASAAAKESAHRAYCFFEQVAEEMVELLFVIDGEQFAGEFHFGFFAEAGFLVGDLAVGP